MEIIIFILGVLVGFFGYFFLQRKEIKGKLRIDRSDPIDKPYLFLELSSSVEDVSRKKYVLFQVSNENFISQN